MANGVIHLKMTKIFGNFSSYHKLIHVDMVSGCLGRKEGSPFQVQEHQFYGTLNLLNLRLVQRIQIINNKTTKQQIHFDSFRFWMEAIESSFEPYANAKQNWSSVVFVVYLKSTLKYMWIYECENETFTRETEHFIT